MEFKTKMKNQLTGPLSEQGEVAVIFLSEW